MTDYKKVFRYALLIAAMVLACRLTDSYAAIAIAIAAFFNSWSRKPTLAVLCGIMFVFTNCITGHIIGQRYMLVIADRIGLMLIGLALYLSSSKRSSKRKVPLGWLFAYCAVAAVPSISGYAPRISFMKLTYFALFILCVSNMAKCVAADFDLAVKARHFFLAVCVLLLVGSLCTLAFPAVAYPLNSRWLMKGGMDLEAANEAMRDGMVPSNIRLFAGITFHSQMLSPLLVFAIGFLMCDMLFIERRMTKFHLALLSLAFPFAYMTRSRTALASLLLLLFAILHVSISTRNISEKLKLRIRGIMTAIILLLVIAAGVAETRSSLITKWIRKNAKSEATTSEAVVATRLGSLAELASDFKRKPILGNGFQVNEQSVELEGRGFVLSAPIEKGFLPFMVLGETGIVGAMVFVAFFISFYFGCRQQGLLCTLLGLYSLILTNLGEATFFSPGGLGGLAWVFALVGGMTLDMLNNGGFPFGQIGRTRS